jgi:hypothetical protein
LILVCWIRIRIGNADPNPDPGEQKWPHKNKKVTKVYVFKCWMLFFESEDLSCSLDVFHGDLGINTVYCNFRRKNINLRCLAIKSLDPDQDRHWHKMLDPDSALKPNAEPQHFF